MNRRTALALAACLLATACSDDAEPTASGGTVRPTQGVATPAAGVPSTATPATPTPAGQATPAFVADTRPDEQEPTGGPLTVTAVRAARQDGYDRVVFELAGRAGGRPGWRVEYVEQATQDGSGRPVDVKGRAFLAVRVHGAGYPDDTGEEEASSATVPGDLEVIEDVELGAVFEGVYEAWIGTSRRAPFRVFALEGPARVVVDVLHG